MTDPLLLAWSGGKDSMLALERLRAQARPVVALLTTVSGADDRVGAHGIERRLVEAQADALGLPLLVADVPAGADNATYEQAFAAALVQARDLEPSLHTIAFGDLFLADVRAFREAMLARIGWAAAFPLWHEDTRALARTFVASGHRAVVCCVDTSLADASLCGRDFDAGLLAALPPACDPCAENGEFHTFVHDGPMLRTPIAIRRAGRTRNDGRFVFAELAPD